MIKTGKTLQEIENHYLRQGLKGEKLRQALEKDKEFQELLKQKKSTIRSKYGITENEEQIYLLPNEEDYKLLVKIKELETKSLNENDKETVKLIKSQLLVEWRKPLIEVINKLLQKYQ